MTCSVSRCCSRYEPGQGWAGFQAGDVSIFLIEVGGELPRGACPARARQGSNRSRSPSPTSRRRSPSSIGAGIEWAADIVESEWYRYRSFYDPEGNVLHITVPTAAPSACRSMTGRGRSRAAARGAARPAPR